MKIVQLIVPARAGGAEQVVLDLSRRLAAEGEQVTVAPVLEPDADGQARPEDHPFMREVSPPVHLRPLIVPGRSYGKEWKGVQELLGELAPDVVHTHGYRSDVLDGAAARRLGFPTVSTVHGFTGGGLKNRAYEFLQRQALRRFDAVVAVSRPLARELARSGLDPARLHTIPNARALPHPLLGRDEARHRLGIRGEGLRIGWIGRMSWEKGPDLLLDALTRLTDLPFLATFVGDGPQRDELRERALQLGIADRVRWPGTVPSASRFIRAFDVLVLSSRSEGTPVVALEAMGARVPLVATTVGGVPDLVGADTALLVPTESPGELARAVRSTFERPDEAIRRAERAEKRFREVGDPGPWARRYVQLYRRVVQPVLARADRRSFTHFARRPTGGDAGAVPDRGS